jgi:serine/threonine-protein kinase HipA
MRRCLYCYDDLGEEKSEFHKACSRKIFGTPTPPELPFSEDQI